MPYQVVDGYNNAGTLADMTPQPRCPEIEPGLLRNDGNGVLVEDGYSSCDLIWSALTDDELDTLYTQFGWSDTVPSNEVTIRLKANSDRDFANYNAVADRPRGRYEDGFWRDMRAHIHHMDAL